MDLRLFWETFWHPANVMVSVRFEAVETAWDHHIFRFNVTGFSFDDKTCYKKSLFSEIFLTKENFGFTVEFVAVDGHAVLPAVVVRPVREQSHLGHASQVDLRFYATFFQFNR